MKDFNGKQRKLEIVSEETEDKFKKEFFPALYEFETEILNSDNYDGEYGLHLRDTIRYQGINDFLMKPFSFENQGKLILKAEKLFVLIPEVEKVGSKQARTPLGLLMADIFQKRENSSLYAVTVLHGLVAYKEKLKKTTNLYEDSQSFERLLVRYNMLKFLADIEEDNDELQKLFRAVRDEYDRLSGVFELEIVSFYKYLRTIDIYQESFDEIDSQEYKQSLKDLKVAANTFNKVFDNANETAIRVAVNKALEDFKRKVSKVPPPKFTKIKRKKEDFSHKILSFEKFKKENSEN